MNLLYRTNWLEYRDSHGLKAGDILLIKRTDRIVRYVGVIKKGLINTPYDKEVLHFIGAIPVSPHEPKTKDFYYFVTEDSSSQGFIDPSTIRGLENISFLNKDVKDLSKDLDNVGNISKDLWGKMEQEAGRRVKEKR